MARSAWFPGPLLASREDLQIRVSNSPTALSIPEISPEFDPSKVYYIFMGVRRASPQYYFHDFPQD